MSPWRKRSRRVWAWFIVVGAYAGLAAVALICLTLSAGMTMANAHALRDVPGAVLPPLQRAAPIVLVLVAVIGVPTAAILLTFAARRALRG